VHCNQANVLGNVNDQMFDGDGDSGNGDPGIRIAGLALPEPENAPACDEAAAALPLLSFTTLLAGAAALGALLLYFVLPKALRALSRLVPGQGRDWKEMSSSDETSMYSRGMIIMVPLGCMNRLLPKKTPAALKTLLPSGSG